MIISGRRYRTGAALVATVAVAAAASGVFGWTRPPVATKHIQAMAGLPSPSVAPVWSPEPSPSPSPSPSPAPPPAYVLRPAGGPFVTPPPMGWNGFNHFHLQVNAAIVEAEARALVASGMNAAGYRYVNLDGGWDLPTRSSSGALQPDPVKFPAGIAPLAAFVHGLGLKFGIYISAGYLNCAGTSAGSYGYYQQDAATFASWGVDYLKLDWCDMPWRSYPNVPRSEVSLTLARQMAAALRATGRPILLDVNDWTNDAPWLWAPAVCPVWRVTPDIQDSYWSMVGNFVRDVSISWQARPGGWNDPDMLEVGNGGMTETEYRTHFSLWALLAAPLIAGNDLVAMTPATRAILMNRAVIAVDQDPLGRQGYAVTASGGLWVLVKPLADGSLAVVLFNAGGVAATISTTAAQVGFGTPATYTLQDLWTGAVTHTTGGIQALVPAHGVVMYRVS